MRSARRTNTSLHYRTGTLNLTSKGHHQNAVRNRVIRSSVSRGARTLRSFLSSTSTSGLLTLNRFRTLGGLRQLATQRAAGLMGKLTTRNSNRRLKTRADTITTQTQLLTSMLLRTHLNILVHHLNVTLMRSVTRAQRLNIPLTTTPVRLLVISQGLLITRTIWGHAARPQERVLPQHVSTRLGIFTSHDRGLQVMIEITGRTTGSPINSQLQKIFS